MVNERDFGLEVKLSAASPTDPLQQIKSATQFQIIELRRNVNDKPIASNPLEGLKKDMLTV